jgi:hypothetical protein
MRRAGSPRFLNAKEMTASAAHRDLIPGFQDLLLYTHLIYECAIRGMTVAQHHVTHVVNSNRGMKARNFVVR